MIRSTWRSMPQARSNWSTVIVASCSRTRSRRPVGVLTGARVDVDDEGAVDAADDREVADAGPTPADAGGGGTDGAERARERSVPAVVPIRGVTSTAACQGWHGQNGGDVLRPCSGGERRGHAFIVGTSAVPAGESGSIGVADPPAVGRPARRARASRGACSADWVSSRPMPAVRAMESAPAPRWRRNGVEHLLLSRRQAVAGVAPARGGGSTRCWPLGADQLEHLLASGHEAGGTLADQLVDALGLGCRDRAGDTTSAAGTDGLPSRRC